MSSWRTWAARVLVLGLVGLAGCASLPALDGRLPTRAIDDTAGTRLGQAIAPLEAAHPGLSGVHALTEGTDAFAARGLLAAAAERSLDVQYYIWHPDEAGLSLFEALWKAADRNVRVRLLLDDNNTGGMDPLIATLDAHPFIEVRLYNPVAQRSLRALNFLTDFSRVNRRMHNKSFTADNQVAVVGGRNVGNEYYGIGSGVEFADADVMVVGPAVREVSAAFDRYWNSASAYPARALVGAAAPGAEQALQARFAQTRDSPAAQSYQQALRTAPFVRELMDATLKLEWSRTLLVVDDPAKTLAPEVSADQLLLLPLLKAMGDPQASFDLVSPYLVPAAKGTEAIAALARSGVRVRILTNSLAATDVGAVHSGYAKRRPDLLAAGVKLYEIKPTALSDVKSNEKSRGSSSSALHAKTFSVDGGKVFVGSFNFDPRSALLNTEMGLVIDSPVLAAGVSRMFDEVAPLGAYEVRLKPDGGSLEWIERTPQGEVRHDTEPGTSALRRLGVGLMSWLPIEWLL
ncbi:MAG: phospholipase D family protein [Burkholderiaceae bacterium]|nr:phospholipase D family protein [Burkholderiaceae bacterium]